jgi:cell division protein FtsA
VEPRYDELFTLVQAELRRSGFENLIPAGIVLTGGTSKMEGVIELAEEIFDMPVRLGIPQNVRGMRDIVTNPIYSTGVGLLLYGMKQKGMHKVAAYASRESSWNRLKGWLARNF